MYDESDYDRDSAYTLVLPPCSREDAASAISIRVDDGADLVIDVGSRGRGRINAYLTVDQAEDLLAALAEILRLPSDRTGALNRTGPIQVDTDGDGVPRPR